MFLASFLANDPLKCFLELDLFWVGLIGALATVPAYWAIDFICSFFDWRIDPLLGTWCRWYSNWVGDLFFITAAITLTAKFYQHAQLNEESWTTSTGFTIGCIVGAIAIPTLLVLTEELSGSYQRSDKINPNRVYHWFYMAFASYILLGAVMRAFFDWSSYSGGKPDAIAGLFAFFGWIVTIYMDRIGYPNPLLNWSRKRSYIGRPILT